MRKKQSPLHSLKITLTSAQRVEYPRLAQYLDHSRGLPPSVSRVSRYRLEHLRLMHAALGPLALLRISLRECNLFDLHDPELLKRVRDLLPAKVEPVTCGQPVYTVNVQRGRHDGTHVHLAMPRQCLTPILRAEVEAAPAGLGGGVEPVRLTGLHAVSLNSAQEDLERAARYLSRHPDSRLDGQYLGTPPYLQAQEEELLRKAAHHRSRRHGWTVGVGTLEDTFSLELLTL